MIVHVALTLALSSPALPPPRPELDFRAASEIFLAAHDLEGVKPEDVDLSALLAKDFFSAQVGLFEVWIPAVDLGEKETAQDYRDICAALCAAQDHWLGWLEEKAIDGKKWRKTLASHRKWVEKWPVSRLSSAKVEDRGEALDFFDAKANVCEQSAALSTALRNGAVLGESREAAVPVRLVLIPRRKEFVEFLAFAGWCRPDWKSSFWVEGAQNWNEFRLDDLQVIALQYPSSDGQEDDYTQFSSMKDRALTGLEEQVVQLGMNGLLNYEHGGSIPGQLVKGLSINMIIELYGACHTLLDGDLHGARTDAREAFVRGGNSEGGDLMMSAAGSRWRAEHGKHHYVRILKQAQKSGASSDKRNRHKYNAFLLIGRNEGDRFVVHVPLFESSTPPELPTDKLMGDYQEFDRAYRSAFLFWLQTTAAGSKKKSKDAFSTLLAQLAKGAGKAEDEGQEGDSVKVPTFAEVVLEVYGAPLSDPEVGLGSLEGRFLKWVSQQ